MGLLLLLLLAAAAAGCAGRHVRPELLALWAAGSTTVGLAPIESATTGPRRAAQIDLPGVLALARARPIEVAIARERLAAAEADWLQGVERLAPSLRFGADYWRLDGLDQNNNGDFVDAGGRQTFHYAGQAALEWQLGDALLGALGASERVDAAAAAGEVARLVAVQRAADAYLDLELAAGRAEVVAASVAVAERLERSLEAAAGVGLASNADVLAVRARAARQRLEAERVAEARAVASVRLAALLRLDPAVDLSPAGPAVPVTLVAPDVPLSTLLDQAERARPELAEAAARRRAAEREHDRAVWGPLVPSVRASASFGDYGPVSTDLETRKVFSVGLWWTIGPGGLLDLGRIDRAAADARAMSLAEVGRREGVHGEVLAAHAEVRSRRAQLELARAGLLSAAGALELQERRQALGIARAFELVDAERALTQARLDELEATVAYTRAQHRLWAATGATAP